MRSSDLRAGQGLRGLRLARDAGPGLGLVVGDNGRISSPQLLGSGATGAGAKYLADDGSYKVIITSPVAYRKTTAKAVNTTIAATDLLNGEITVAANAMGASSILRLTALGDWKNNPGSSNAPPRFQLILGGTTLIDTGTSGAAANLATRWPWKITAEIQNLGATNSQTVDFALVSGAGGWVTAVTNAFTTGTGLMSNYGSTATAVVWPHVAHGVNTSAVDMTASRTLVLNVINGANNANYETKLFSAFVEII